jgi:hypothetical protein
LKNSFYEEFFAPENISKFHAKLIEDAKCPEWVKNIECPYCHKTLPLNSIMGIGLKLNARNIFDISVDFCCHFCKIGNTLYFEREIENISQFADFITGAKTPKNPPIVDDDLRKKNENKLMSFLYETIEGKKNGN